jgi:HTH-type transcriptional regulator, sugar sensing transcriptional regulator
MNIFDHLKQLNLTNSEIRIYLFLLENGLMTPPAIARGTKIARTNCYNILNSLKSMDLIEEHRHSKRKAYIASDPESLFRRLDKKRSIVQEILPDLRGIYSTQKNKPKIKFYEGKEQIKEIYLATLKAEKILGIGSTKQLSDFSPKFYTNYLNEIKNRGIIFYDILSHSSKEKGAPEMKNMLKGLYDVNFLPERYKDLPTDILIWDDNIALITLKEPVFGTILNNSLLAETFKIIFDILKDKIQR